MLGLILLSLLAATQARQTRIVGGSEVDPVGRWPWQCELQFLGSLNCGCVLIENPEDATNNIYVLTAAHCVGSSASSYTIILGQHDTADSSVASPESYSIEYYIQHPHWTNTGTQGFPNDMALLVLSRPANLTNEFIQPITFSDDDTSYYEDAECWISGWGRLNGGGVLPNLLQETEIPTLSRAACDEYWASNLNHGHICVMDEVNQDKGACNGDSGGPLQCSLDGGDTWELVGLTSWGRTGCVTSSPSVYNRVGWYSSWLRCVIQLGGVDDNGVCDSVCPCDSPSCQSVSPPCKLPPSSLLH